MPLTRRSLTLGLSGFGLIASGFAHRAAAAPLPVPTGKVILTITGKISVTNNGKDADFDRAMLEGLGSSSFTTSTPWYDGPVSFEGVPMAKLMNAVQPSGDTVVATALNDYETKIPISDFAQFNVLLALKRNGNYMPVSDKGPLFIVYPYDSDPALKSQKYYSRSAWQLRRIVIT